MVAVGEDGFRVSQASPASRVSPCSFKHRLAQPMTTCFAKSTCCIVQVPARTTSRPKMDSSGRAATVAATAVQRSG